MAEEMTTLTIDARRYAKDVILQVDVRIVNLRMVRLRIRLALWLCRIAVWLGGIGLEINQDVGVLITEENKRDFRSNDTKIIPKRTQTMP